MFSAFTLESKLLDQVRNFNLILLEFSLQVPLFFEHPGNHMASSIVLIQSMCQLLPRLVQVLPKVKDLEHQRVPFTLQELKNSRNIVRNQWFWRAGFGNFECDKICGGIQRDTGHWALTSCREVLLYQTFLENVPEEVLVLRF